MVRNRPHVQILPPAKMTMYWFKGLLEIYLALVILVMLITKKIRIKSKSFRSTVEKDRLYLRRKVST